MSILKSPFDSSNQVNTVDSAIYGYPGAVGGSGVGLGSWHNHLNLSALTMDDVKKLKEAMDKHNKPRESATVADEQFRMKAIGMRLRLTQGERFPFDHFSTAHSGDKVFAFLVVKGSPVVLEDESVMFPSDTFMTQLRMLMDWPCISP
jgi:hypothetical protein